MNLPSLDKYEALVQPGGTLIINASLVNRSAERKDIHAVSVPANEIAESLGDIRLTNIVLVGAILAKANPKTLVAGNLRISVGTPEDMDAVVTALETILHAK